MMNKPNNKKGFSLIELVIIILVIGILSAIAVVSMPNITDMRVMQAAYKIQSDIRYAQRLAMSTQRRIRIAFRTNNDNYTIYRENNYGSGSWGVVENPLTHGQFNVQLNADEFRGVDITEVFFNEANMGLVFDEYGRPYSYNTSTKIATPLGNQGWVRLNNTKYIRVTQNTGRVNIQ